MAEPSKMGRFPLPLIGELSLIRPCVCLCVCVCALRPRFGLEMR